MPLIVCRLIELIFLLLLTLQKSKIISTGYSGKMGPEERQKNIQLYREKSLQGDDTLSGKEAFIAAHDAENLKEGGNAEEPAADVDEDKPFSKKMSDATRKVRCCDLLTCFYMETNHAYFFVSCLFFLCCLFVCLFVFKASLSLKEKGLQRIVKKVDADSNHTWEVSLANTIGISRVPSIFLSLT
mgnify:CR=1 FL=1